MRTSSRLAATVITATCLLGITVPAAAFADDTTPSAAPVAVTTTSPSPSPSDTAGPAVTDITYNRVADPTAVRIKWTAPDSDNTYTYTVRVVVNGDEQTQATTNTSLDVNSLDPGDKVQAYITASNGGRSGTEVAGSQYTQPKPAVATPKKISLSQLNKTSLRVTWQPGDNTSQSYLVSLTGGNGASPKQVGGTSIDFTGLSSGYTYTATVTAVADSTGYRSLPSDGKKLTLDPDFGASIKPTPAPTVTVTTQPSSTATVSATPKPTKTAAQQPQPQPSASDTAAPTKNNDNMVLNTVLLTLAAITLVGIIICAIGLYLDTKKRKQRAAEAAAARRMATGINNLPPSP